MSTEITETNLETNSTWKTKLKAMGPGILMASAAVGGSHIVSSAQAGAIYGWQLLLVVILVNLFKYPFFRFGVQYTLNTEKSLVEGYSNRGKAYLWIFFILNVFSAMVNTAAVGILTGAIMINIIPKSWGISVGQITIILIILIWAMIILGGYSVLDGISKFVMITLTLATTIAVIIAAIKGGRHIPANFVAPSPWNLAALPFIISLMGWMPAPIEISAINSMWLEEKKRTSEVSYEDGLFDFNVGYIGTAILAVIFLALGALIQYGSPEKVKPASAAYIAQLIKMYMSEIGSWSRLLIAFIAFMCLFGTTITVIDGYSRANDEALRILLGKEKSSQKALNIWFTVTSIIGILIVLLLEGNVAKMMRFAMIASFISTPVFAWLNLQLVKTGKHKVSGALYWLSVVGLIYLLGFAIFFLIAYFGKLV